MNNKETKYFSTAMLANGLQLFLCFIAYILSLFINVNNFIVATVMLAAQILIWLICGFKIAVSGKMDKFWKLFVGAFVAIAPILVYTSISYSVSKFVAIDNQGWTHFFFLGGPLIFYNKPITLLMGLFRGHGYLMFAANYIILFVCYFIGEFFGFIINGGKKIAKERRNKKANKVKNTLPEKTKKKDKKEKKLKKKNKKKQKQEQEQKEEDTNILDAEDNKEDSKQEQKEEIKEKAQEKDKEEPEDKEEYQPALNDDEEYIEEDITNTSELIVKSEEEEDRLAEEIVNNILKENLKGQREKGNE